jgi:amino-acid N-acetyltransferase
MLTAFFWYHLCSNRTHANHYAFHCQLPTSTMVTLRPATAADTAAIRSLVYSARINPTGLDWRRFVVAVSPGGEVIGCGQVKPHRDGSRELASIVVAPQWRGDGTARLIIEHLIANHPGPLFLTCRAVLGPFYEKFGFRRVGEAEMTPYFRKLSRLARLIGFVGLESGELLIMSRPG